MKRTYIAPQTDIETLRLRGSVMEEDPGYGEYSDTSDDPHANTMNIEEAELETEIIHSANLWDE